MDPYPILVKKPGSYLLKKTFIVELFFQLLKDISLIATISTGIQAKSVSGSVPSEIRSGSIIACTETYFTLSQWRGK